ncbi:hypothetical protein ACKFKF_06230 [Phormidesmis sp. 146-12]
MQRVRLLRLMGDGVALLLVGLSPDRLTATPGCAPVQTARLSLGKV